MLRHIQVAARPVGTLLCPRQWKFSIQPSTARRPLSIKSADEFFLPSIHSPPSTEHSTGLPRPDGGVDDAAFYERDIELLDHELESLLGPLQEKVDADDDAPAAWVPPPHPNNLQSRLTVSPASHAFPRERVQPLPVAAPNNDILPPKHPHVVIVNGPCTLVGGLASGRPWTSLQLELEGMAARAGTHIDVHASNHEGAVIDCLLSTPPHATVVLNCGDLLAAYPGIQKAVELTPAKQVILLSDTPYTTPVGRHVRQLTGFGADAYKLAMLAAKEL